jgi:Carboxypeptidase regulatory-like domain
VGESRMRLRKAGVEVSDRQALRNGKATNLRKLIGWRLEQSLAILVAIGLLSFPLPGNAAGMMGVAKVAGTAERNGLPLPNGSIVSSGDVISTHSKSALQLSLTPQERLWLGPDSSAKVTKNAGNLVIALEHGTVGFASRGHVQVTINGRDFALRSRHESPVQAQLAYRNREQAQIWLRKGSVEIEQAGKSVVLQAGRSRLISSLNTTSPGKQPAEYVASEQTESNNGTVKGTVVNAQLFVVPNATATLVTSTGFTYTATTNAAGAFIFNNVPPGTYTLRVTGAGYPPYETQNLVVTSGQVTSVYVELNKGKGKPAAGMKNKGLVIGVIAGAGAALGIGLGVALSGGNKTTVSPSTVP